MGMYRVVTTVEATVEASSEEMARLLAREAFLTQTGRVRPLSIHSQTARDEAPFQYVSCSSCGQQFHFPNGRNSGFSHCDQHECYEALSEDEEVAL